MKMTRLCRLLPFCFTGVLASNGALAEVLNISTAGLQSNTIQQTACTIVSNKNTPDIKGYRALVVFAESREGGQNPKVRAESLSRNNRHTNTDWRGAVYKNGAALKPVNAENFYAQVLRLPARASDAALTFFAKPGESVCAFSLEEGADGNTYPVSLSITDVTEKYLATYGPNGNANPTVPPHPDDRTSCATNFVSSFDEDVNCDEIRALPGGEFVFRGGDGGGNGGDGGGGDGGDAGADGTGADGAPIQNAVIIFTDAEGRIVRTRTDSVGYFRINIGGLVAPITARIQRSNNAWMSAMVEIIEKAPARTDFYTINLTGLTDAALARLAQDAGVPGGSDAVTPSVLATNSSRLPNAIASVNSQISPQLSASGLSAQSFNPFNMPFRPDRTGYDKVLDSLTITKSSSGTTISESTAPKQCIDPSLINQSAICPSVYIPVCGCNGATYSNSCVAENYYGVTVWTEGACQTDTCVPSAQNNYCE